MESELFFNIQYNFKIFFLNQFSPWIFKNLLNLIIPYYIATSRELFRCGLSS